MNKRIMITAVLLVCALLFSFGCKPIVVPPITIDYGNFEKRFDEVGFEVMDIEDSIAKGSDKMAAFVHLMEVAETNWDSADYLAKFTDGSGEAYTGKIGGKMTGRSLYLRNPSSFYYIFGSMLTESNPKEGLPAAQAMLNQCRREYSSDMKTFYQQEPKNNGKPTISYEFPFFSCDYTKAKVESFNAEEWKIKRENKDKIGEFTSFVFDEQTVLADSISIEYKEEYGYYTLYFELNLEDKEARDRATEFPRKILRDIAQSNDIEYRVYNLTMEIWDNGLIRSIETEESWEGSIKVWILPTLHGSSSSSTKDYYSWDPKDCEYASYGLDIDWIP